MEQGLGTDLQAARIAPPAHGRRNAVLPARARLRRPNMTSLLARASAFGIRVLRIGSPYVSEEALTHHIEHNRIGPVPPPRAMRRRVDVSSRLYRGREVFTVGPKPRGRRNDRAGQ